MNEDSWFRVKYQAGTYSGHRDVQAPDLCDAIEKVKARIRGEMTLPMYYESYSGTELEHGDA